MSLRLTDDDLDVLDALEASPEPLDEGTAADASRLWEKVGVLLDELGERMPGEFDADLWPWRLEDAIFPFLWGRLKQRGAERYATHLGLFLSTDGSNFCLDLEKDLVDAGESVETAAEVREYFRDRLPGALPDEVPESLMVWTDPDNVVDAAALSGASFDEFMAANNDPEHPWPKLGYLLDPEDHVSMGDGWPGEMAARASHLLPVYRDMLDTFGD